MSAKTFITDDMNILVQAWKGEDGSQARGVWYMPRKERCFSMDGVALAEGTTLQDEARESARYLRKLAEQMEAFADGSIDHAYYPTLQE